MPTVVDLLGEIAEVGGDPVHGYDRHLFTQADADLTRWFIGHAERLGLRVEQDRNLNLWAYWDGAAEPRVVATGSHLDSVPGGGAFDGPLGVASAFRAIELLQEAGFRPSKTIGVAAFAEEEGGGFGMPCVGTRLMTGIADPVALAARVNAEGLSFADAAALAGADIDALGPDADRLRAIDCFVEVHVEQGRYLADKDVPLATASQVFAHGRWRFDFSGEGNHAGTTAMADRRDPMVAAARFILALTESAARREQARATVGRIVAIPGGVNVIASTVTAWADVRAGSVTDVETLVAEIASRAGEIADDGGCQLSAVCESLTPATFFSSSLTERVENAIGSEISVPRIPTGAGHDAAVLGDRASIHPIPTAMIFVRNPTGRSHTPMESASAADCELGAEALARVLRELS